MRLEEQRMKMEEDSRQRDAEMHRMAARMEQRDWLKEDIPGVERVADVGTKVMRAPKLSEMKAGTLGLMTEKEEPECDLEEKKDVDDPKPIPKKTLQRAASMIQLAVFMGELVGADAEEEESDVRFTDRVCFAAILLLAFISTITVVWIAIRGREA